MTRLLLSTLSILFVGGGCGPNGEAQIEANKAVVREMTEAINNRELDRLDDLVAEDLVRHCQATPGVNVRSLSEFKEFLRQDFASVPDSKQEIEMLIGEGDRVAAYVSYRGTQTGTMGPFPASGNRVDLKFIGILRIENGKVAEIWVEWDNLTVLTQLGHFPPGKAAADA
jgi:steroid delta-isomerase-like uncharacterized protein